MTGQYLLLTGALAILSLLMLTFNRTQNQNLTTSLNNEAIISSAALAQGLMDEICTRAFDEKTKSKGVTSADSLTPSISLGPDAGEFTTSQFDDIDDFNNYSQTKTLPRLGAFNLSVRVNYIQNLSPNVVINTRSFSKKIDVFIFSTYLPDTLEIHNIIAY
ncbi:MAG: hypothetical protein KKB34_15515 [Bacteroidetes bacterium]|nr:hypothetical protein [Bacteroidota bacterium]